MRALFGYTARLIRRPAAVLAGFALGWFVWAPDGIAFGWLTLLGVAPALDGTGTWAVLGYTLGASHYIALSGAAFTGLGWAGAVFGVAYVGMTAGAYVGCQRLMRGILHHKRSPGVGMLLWLTLITLPPLGAIGLASPLFAAADLLPGAGLYGLLMTALLVSGLASASAGLHYGERLGQIFDGAGVVILVGFLALTPPPALISRPVRVRALHLTSPRLPAVALAAEAEAAIIGARARAALTPCPRAPTLLATPEYAIERFVLGARAGLAQAMPRLSRCGAELIIGAGLLDPTTGQASDGAIVLGAGSPRLIVAQQPVPVAEWRPGLAKSVPAHWGADETFTLPAGGTGLISMCYEQFLIFPAALDRLLDGRFDLIVALQSHLWATAAPGEAALQARAARAEGRVYGVPVAIIDRGPAQLAKSNP
jgi:hypothetical protein